MMRRTLIASACLFACLAHAGDDWLVITSDDGRKEWRGIAQSIRGPRAGRVEYDMLWDATEKFSTGDVMSTQRKRMGVNGCAAGRGMLWQVDAAGVPMHSNPYEWVDPDNGGASVADAVATVTCAVGRRKGQQ